MSVKLGLGVVFSLGLWTGIGLPVIANDPSSNPAIVAQAKGKLTEENILQAIKEIQAAQNQENLDELLKYVAPFATSEITLEGRELSTTLQVDGKENHRVLLQDMFKKIKSREILTQNIDIRLTSDESLGIAEVLTVKELIDEEGKRYINSSQDVWHFAWLDNRPTLVYVKSKGWLEEVAK
jgi:hypothetical protein